LLLVCKTDLRCGLAGTAPVALSMVLMLRVTAEADPLAREDLAFALSVVLLGLWRVRRDSAAPLLRAVIE
jgi:hypothetical protein